MTHGRTRVQARQAGPAVRLHHLPESRGRRRISVAAADIPDERLERSSPIVRRHGQGSLQVSRNTIVACASAAGIALGLVLKYFDGGRGSAWTDAPLFVVLCGGGVPLVGGLAWRAIHSQFGADHLAAVSIVASARLGEYLAGSIVVLMLSGGQALEQFAVAQATSVLRALAARPLDMQVLPCLLSGKQLLAHHMTARRDPDLLFKALADPSRRTLLDLLHAHDGRTLNDLCEHLDMSRQGVTQHLDVLEAANLVATVRRGREKLHFLNPVPLQEIYERWIAKFEKPRLKALGDLKRRLEKTDA